MGSTQLRSRLRQRVNLPGNAQLLNAAHRAESDLYLYPSPRFCFSFFLAMVSSGISGSINLVQSITIDRKAIYLGRIFKDHPLHLLFIARGRSVPRHIDQLLQKIMSDNTIFIKTYGAAGPLIAALSERPQEEDHAGFLDIPARTSC